MKRVQAAEDAVKTYYRNKIPTWGRLVILVVSISINMLNSFLFMGLAHVTSTDAGKAHKMALISFLTTPSPLAFIVFIAPDICFILLFILFFDMLMECRLQHSSLKNVEV